MPKKVIGSYSSEEEAIQAVNAFELKGYDSDDLTVMTGRGKTKELRTFTDANVEKTGSGAGSGSFWEKIKKVLTYDAATNLPANQQLTDQGVHPDDAERYAAELDDGKILVTADLKEETSL